MCGCDEAGRGALAGPVFSAAVILPKHFREPTLDDSKKLTEKQRIFLKGKIEEKALSLVVVSVGVEEIDKTNILKATIKGVHLAISQLSIRPELILMDGHYFRPSYPNIPHKTIIKGDQKYREIAAASILAKTYRDLYMKNIHLQFPSYLWFRNKGYPTKAHRRAISEMGICIHHRKTFRLSV